MLLGVEKKRKEEEMESKFSLRSEPTAAEMDDSCKILCEKISFFDKDLFEKSNL